MYSIRGDCCTELFFNCPSIKRIEGVPTHHWHGWKTEMWDIGDMKALKICYSSKLICMFEGWGFPAIDEPAEKCLAVAVERGGGRLFKGRKRIYGNKCNSTRGEGDV